MRVLVSPASRHGGTAQIGRAIATTLRDLGVDVDVTQPEDVVDLTCYDGFVIGSALYLGSWLPAACAFVDDNAQALRRRPTWLFSSGPLGAATPAEPVDAREIERLVDTTDARSHHLFGGRLELARLSRSDRFIAEWAGAVDGDYRDWDEIETWAADIAASLTADPDDDGARRHPQVDGSEEHR
ncbi:MAG: flavodoxin domain-containing protein [Acidimicrobiales bacterium]